MDQPVLDSNIKFTVSLKRAVTATLRALLFQQRICALVSCEWPSVVEQSSCRSTGSTSLPSYTLYLSFSPSSCLPSASLPFTARLSLTPPLSYLCGPSVSVWFSPCLGHPPSLSLRACLQRVSGHASYLLTLTGMV